MVASLRGIWKGGRKKEEEIEQRTEGERKERKGGKGERGGQLQKIKPFLSPPFSKRHWGDGGREPFNGLAK